MQQLTSVPVIVVICYLVITAIKGTKIPNRLYPIISAALGAACALIFHLVCPEFLAAATLANALVTGAVSGLAATGTNQVFKQLLKKAQDGELIT